MKAPAAYGEYVVALAELDLGVGMRPGELLNARWADVDAVNRHISITQTKNDKPRLVPLTARALEIFKSLRQDAPDDERIFDQPQRLSDAVNSLEKGTRLISGTPTLRQVARGA